MEKDVVGVGNQPFIGGIDDLAVDHSDTALGAALYAADEQVDPDVVAVFIGVILHFLAFAFAGHAWKRAGMFGSFGFAYSQSR
jgi:hypothetical protein